MRTLLVPRAVLQRIQDGRIVHFRIPCAVQVDHHYETCPTAQREEIGVLPRWMELAERETGIVYLRAVLLTVHRNRLRAAHVEDVRAEGFDGKYPLADYINAWSADYGIDDFERMLNTQTWYFTVSQVQIVRRLAS